MSPARLLPTAGWLRWLAILLIVGLAPSGVAQRPAPGTFADAAQRAVVLPGGSGNTMRFYGSAAARSGIMAGPAPRLAGPTGDDGWGASPVFAGGTRWTPGTGETGVVFGPPIRSLQSIQSIGSIQRQRAQAGLAEGGAMQNLRIFLLEKFHVPTKRFAAQCTRSGSTELLTPGFSP